MAPQAWGYYCAHVSRFAIHTQQHRHANMSISHAADNLWINAAPVASAPEPDRSE